ncbi:RNA-directed DNA polymerase from transposon X-element [Elysia marginata]|uniref:RNA-directed DNA polymerase from transposon X-element n=1 Tax=Elysia marginata TaxID=1093978 RepID=A0AAV4JCZ3_9GAST|nr:RNA-directed DNA polymerase from transposon X-element [Elysia marginata]
MVFRQEFAQLREKYAAYNEAFTDGSKREKVTAASFYPKDPDKPEQTRLNGDSTVLNAELEGILLALKYFKRKRILRSVINTDNLSAIRVQGKIFKNKNVAHIYNLFAKRGPRTKVVLVWIPSHIEIPGNEKMDELAKFALNQEMHGDKQVIWSDLKLKVHTHLEQLWQTDWDTEVDNKLHEIRPNLKERLVFDERLSRKQETVVSRLRIGHSWITHKYLLTLLYSL